MSQRSVGSVVLLTGFVACGCSLWHAAEIELSELPATRMSEDSVKWEIGVVYVSPDDTEFHEQLWKQLDEQHLPVDVMRRLADNGFRCGLAGMQLPDVLRERLDRQSTTSPGSDAVPLSELKTALQQRDLQVRAGQRHEIVGPRIHDELIVLFNDEGELRGNPYYQAQSVLALRSFPQGDGSVKLEVTPEIHHGPVRQYYTGGDEFFQMEARRDSVVFDKLRCEVTFSPGQTLVMTTTRDGKLMGGKFFMESVDGRPQQKLLLIRLAQTQYDDLFSPPKSDTSSLTSVD